MEELRTLKEEDFVEAIKEGEIVKVPESIALEEDLFILRKLIKPVKEVVENKKSENVYRSTGILNEWKSAKVKIKKNNVTSDLVNNFHWFISRNRRLKNLTRKELADRIGASEEDMKMIEMGGLPSDDFILINRIEEILDINLRKEKLAEGNVTLSDLQKMNESKVREEIKKTHMGGLKTGSGDISGDEIEIIDFD
jgi:ribosome-binding protein aMBF1 (putative translation factor)